MFGIVYYNCFLIMLLQIHKIPALWVVALYNDLYHFRRYEVGIIKKVCSKVEEAAPRSEKKKSIDVGISENTHQTSSKCIVLHPIN